MDPSAQQPGRPRLDDKDPKYDEYYESMSDAELTREALERMFKDAELLGKAHEDEIDELRSDLESEIESDPYLSYVRERYESMEASEMSLLIKAAEKRPFDRYEMAAFTDLIMSLDFAAADPYTIFSLEYLKLIAAQMTSEQRVHLMAKLPVGVQEYAVGIMLKIQMVTPHEVQTYAGLVSEGELDPAGEAATIMREVELVGSDIDMFMDSLPADQKNHTTTHYDAPQSSMDRKYTVQNALKAGGLFVGIMTLIINTSGAVRKLFKGKPREAMEHIMSHPYGPLSVLAIAGFKRALDRVDRPIHEFAVSGERSRLSELIDSGVSRETIVSVKNRDTFDALMDDVEGAQDVEDLRDLPFEEAFPELSTHLEDRGLAPLAHMKEKVKNEYIDYYLLLRREDYWSYDATFKFADYASKKYYKVAQGEAYRAADELDEQKRGVQTEATEDPSSEAEIETT